MEKKNKKTEKNSIENTFYIQPWGKSDEFIECYEKLFSTINSNKPIIDFINDLSLDQLRLGFKTIIVWESRNDNKTFTLSTLLLIDTIIKIKSGEFKECSIDSNHIMGEVIIRVTNLIIDELRKAKKTSNANMYIVAKEINLPEYIIEIRHACTHKNLPQFNSLILSVELLFLWVKENFWDRQYKILIQERNLYNYLMLCIENNEMVPKDINEEYDEVNFEICHLLNLIVKLYQHIEKDYCDRKAKGKQKQNILLYKSFFEFIFKKEKELFVLLLFQFIIQQVLIVLDKESGNASNLSKESEEYIKRLNYFSSFILENTEFKDNIDYQTYEIFFRTIEGKLEFISEINAKTSKEIAKVFYSIFPNMKDKKESMDIKEIIKESRLYTIGSIKNTKKSQNYLNYDIIKEETNTNDNEDIEMCNEYEFYNTLIL